MNTTATYANAKSTGSRTILEITSTNNYGEIVVEYIPCDEFYVPGTWKAQHVSGIYGEYIAQEAESDVIWTVVVDRKN